ncbi:hypothetical protein KCP74_17435 [Salmonella enterica subsp. enterica]|nr:hypothetical protein KCP74_17435 [Salmonella enterica subsp. enterica]
MLSIAFQRAIPPNRPRPPCQHRHAQYRSVREFSCSRERCCSVAYGRRVAETSRRFAQRSPTTSFAPCLKSISFSYFSDW